MFNQISSYIIKLSNTIIDKIYDGNIVAFKWDPILGSTLSVATIWGIDLHIAVAKVIGTGGLALLSVTIGVIGPMYIRYLMHEFKEKFPFIGKLLKHDKKDKENG